jgi:hypothetical protein
LKLQHNHFIYVFDHNEFLFPQRMKSYLQKFDPSGANCGKDLTKMKVLAAKAIYLHSMQEILKNRYIVEAISKLKEYNKKTKQHAPMCCYRFVLVIKSIIVLGISLTNEMFYYILDICLRNPMEEHANIQVHKTLKIVRDYLHISSEEFLKYLELHEYPACPELLAHIRSIRHKRDRDIHLAVIKKKEVNTLLQTRLSGSRPDSFGGESAAPMTPSEEAGRVRFSGVSCMMDDYENEDEFGAGGTVDTDSPVSSIL